MKREKHMEFFELKDRYYQYRKNERDDLSRYLRNFFKQNYEDKKWKVMAKKGITEYTSGSRLKTKFNLSNWLWIDIDIDELKILLSFQSFDHDPKTGNLHILMDRIGLYVYSGEYSAVEAQTNMFITDIQLPLDNNDKCKIANIVNDVAECEYFKKMGELNVFKKKHDLI